MAILVVTGSREERIEEEAEALIYEAIREFPTGANPIIWHGDCRTGADAVAKRVGDELFGQLPFPALWSKLGDKAGPVRNADMLRQARHKMLEGEDVRVLAIGLQKGKCNGTTNAMEWALKLRLPARHLWL